MNKLAGWLTSDSTIRFQVRFCMASAYIINSARVEWRRARGASKWPHAPRRLAIITWLRCFSTVYFVYAILRNLLAAPLETGLESALGVRLAHPLNCYLLGRFYAQPLNALNRIIGLFACCMHLLWRLVQVLRPIPLNVHNFLCLSTHDLERYYKLAARRASRQVMIDDCKRRSAIKPKPLAKLDSIDWSQGQQSDSSMDEFLDRVLCYQLACVCGKAQLQLRPNRSLAANRELRAQFVRLYLAALGIMLLVFAFTVPIMAVFIVRHDTYARAYSGCEPKPNTLEAEKSQFIGADQAMSWYFYLTVCADAIENLTLWLETCLGFFFGLAFALLLNYDLFIYWQHLHGSVLELAKRLELRQATAAPSCSSQRATSQPGKESRERQSTRQQVAVGHELELLGCTCIQHDSDDSVHGSMRLLQMEINDFFCELSRADLFVSDTLTCVLIVWAFTLTVFFCITPSDLALLKQDELIARVLPTYYWVLLATTLLLAIVFWAFLALHRHSSRTYAVLCSLIARYKSPLKINFLPMMDKFVDYRTCYSLFRHKPLISTTYLSLMGWSISCFVVLRGISKTL